MTRISEVSYRRVGRAVAQAVTLRLPTATARVLAWVGQVMGDLGWTVRHWGKFYPSTSLSSGTHATGCSTLITTHHRGLLQ